LTVGVGRGVARCLPCFCPATQTQRSTQTHKMHVRVPCTCLHGPLVRACPAPAGACYSLPCACAVQNIWLTCSIEVSSSTHEYLFARWYACMFWPIPRACECLCCACAGPLCVRALHFTARAVLCLRVGFVLHLVDIVVSFPVPYLVVVHRGSPIVSRSS